MRNKKKTGTEYEEDLVIRIVFVICAYVYLSACVFCTKVCLSQLGHRPVQPPHISAIAWCVELRNWLFTRVIMVLGRGY
uniref:Transmembrane protein n=1 Tax=Syphacia muris TaxID=451379 RepID=A0A0N5ATT7_9BILA